MAQNFRRIFGNVVLFGLLISGLGGGGYQVALAANVDAVGDITVTVLPNPGDVLGNQSEYFIVSFAGSGTLNLDGWTVSDTLASENIRHTFGAVSLTDGQTFKVCGDSTLGTGCDAEVDNGGNAIWNNTGDSLLLKDEFGEIILEVVWNTATVDLEYSNSTSADFTPPLTPTLDITAPSSDFDYVSGVYEFVAEYNNGSPISNFSEWEIYAGDCEVNAGALFGNVDNLNDTSDFADNIFTASIDTSGLASGYYCFSVNPASDDQPDLRANRIFYVDNYSPVPYRPYIEGSKWNDANGDGYWDENEEALRGWTIIIDDGEGTRSTVTDGDGHYSFDVSPGIWTVSEEGQSGWQQTGLRINGEDQKEFNPALPNCVFEVSDVVVTLNDVVSVAALSVTDNYVNVAAYRCDFGNQQIQQEEIKSSSRSTGTKVGQRQAPAGQVLGASTSNSGGTKAPMCGRYLFDYMRAGTVTYAKEVIKLQTFLTGQGFFTPTTGIFDDTTSANVRLFQAAHLSEILTPWNITEPTGYVYKTTRWMINNIICPGSEDFPDLEELN